jgi:DNA primase catalytic subunit
VVPKLGREGRHLSAPLYNGRRGVCALVWCCSAATTSSKKRTAMLDYLE